MERLTEEQRAKALEAFDRAANRVPSRPRAEVEAELREVADARRGGERRNG